MRTTRLLLTLFLAFVGIGAAASISFAQPPIPPTFSVKVPPLQVDPGYRSEGPCPKKVTFTGRITVNRAGIVRYTFLRSDGASGPVHRLRFDAAGSKEVHTSWLLGRSSTGWMATKILSPREEESAKANFEVRCTPLVH